MLKSIKIKNCKYKLPIYLPDATRAVTKSLDSKDLYDAGIEGAVVNTYHLQTNPGTKILSSFGGIKNFMNYHGLIASDSGGWQVFSLIHRNRQKGKITDKGVEFSIGKGSRQLFTANKSIEIQFEIGSDIIICLDDFTPPDANRIEAEKTVERTVKWAKKSKKEYQKQIEKRGLLENSRPLLLAVVQGGYFKDLRKQCAEELLNIGFDAYGYGGYVINDGKLDLELSEFIANLIPQDKIKFALGIGRPLDIVRLSQMGWNIFDCTLPTRDARHKRLYLFNEDPKSLEDLLNENNYSYLYINKEVNGENSEPISQFCDCHTCKNYSRAYLRHLFKIGDVAAFRLATIHNLRFYSRVIEKIRDLT